MPIPPFIANLRQHIGHELLWLPGVTAIVLRADEVLLVQRPEGTWTPVMGIMEPGENVGESALREVTEETTVTAEVDRLVWVRASDVVTYPNDDRSIYLDHVLRCRWVAGEPQVGDDESIDTGFFRLDALPELSRWHRDAIAYAASDDREVRLA